MFVLPLSRPASLLRRTAVAPAFGSAIDRLFDESFDRFRSGSGAIAGQVRERRPDADPREEGARRRHAAEHRLIAMR